MVRDWISGAELDALRPALSMPWAPAKDEAELVRALDRKSVV